MLEDPEKGKNLLDTDLEDYMKARDGTATTTAATTNAASAEKKNE